MVPVLLQADQKKAGAEVSASAASAAEITLGEIYHSSIGNNPLWAPTGKAREHLVNNHCGGYFTRLTHQTDAAILGALADHPFPESLT